jgi:hypothetical protein
MRLDGLVMSRGVGLLFGCAAFDARKGHVSHATMPASELCVPPGRVLASAAST